ncbi:hypothetical protein [Agreia sp.]|uniref:hypothetical protein n=1 Tax=Agreia sp. TaxID=1872416 RepID=UPI0035BBABEC
MTQRIFSASDFQDPPARGRRSGGGSVVGRIVSGLVGLIVTAPALLLVMAGGARSYSETLQRASLEPAAAAILLLSAGLVLVLIVTLSGLFSALGPFVAGAIATGLGVAFLVSPTLVGTVSGALPALGVSPLTLLVFWCQSGLLLATGIVLLGSSLARLIAARTKRVRKGSGARALVSILVGVVVTPFGIGLVAVGSSGLLEAFSRASGSAPAEPRSLIIVTAGAVVLAGVALTTAWSSIGAAIAGVLVVVFGLLAVFPAAVLWIHRTASALNMQIAEGLSSAVAVGFVAVLGLVLLGAAASSARARRAGR